MLLLRGAHLSSAHSINPALVRGMVRHGAVQTSAKRELRLSASGAGAAAEKRLQGIACPIAGGEADAQ